MEISILDDYTTNCLIMTSKVNQNVKHLIINTLRNKTFSSLNKARKDFILSVLWHILSIKGKINFTQLGRFSPYCEQTHRIHFEQEFDFLPFNKLLCEQTLTNDRILAFDPSYIPKAGKQTYGRGRFWSRAATSCPTRRRRRSIGGALGNMRFRPWRGGRLRAALRRRL